MILDNNNVRGIVAILKHQVINSWDDETAIYYSLIESCKLNQVNPLTYMTYLLSNVRNKKKPTVAAARISRA